MCGLWNLKLKYNPRLGLLRIWVPLNTHLDVHSQTHTCTHTLPHTHTHRCIHEHTHSRMHTHMHTHTFTYAHTHSRMHTPTHAHTHTCTHTFTYAHTLTHAHTHSHMHTHLHTHTHAHPTFTYAHTPTHAHTPPHMHTHTCTHIHICTHTCTHPHMYTHTLPHVYLSGLSWGPRKLVHQPHGFMADSVVFPCIPAPLLLSNLREDQVWTGKAWSRDFSAHSPAWVWVGSEVPPGGGGVSESRVPSCCPRWSRATPADLPRPRWVPECTLGQSSRQTPQ